MTISAGANPGGRGKLGNRAAGASCSRLRFAGWHASESVYNIGVARPATVRPLVFPSALRIHLVSAKG